MKRILTFILAVSVLAGCSEKSAQPKYIFFFLGDGMGFSLVELAEMYANDHGTAYNDSSLVFTEFPVSTNVRTRSHNNRITCSSAACTAFACGEKTDNGMLGMDPEGNALTSIASGLKAQKGYKIAVITNVTVNHATPAGYYSSQERRNNYYEIGLDAAGSGFDFFGGQGVLEAMKKDDPEAPCLYDVFRDSGYTVCRGMEEFRNRNTDEKIMLFSRDTSAGTKSLSYEIDRQEGELSLEDLTKSCVDVFSRTAGDGFFAMIEGGHIDYSCHANDGATALREVLDFDRSIRVAYDFYRKHPDETLILVTADHETGGLVLGIGGHSLEIENLMCQKSSLDKMTADIRNMKRQQPVPAWEEVKSYLRETVGFWDEIPLTAAEEQELKDCYVASFLKNDAEDVVSLYARDDAFSSLAVSILNTKAGLVWASHSHTATAVPLYAVGAHAGEFNARIDNTEIARKLRKLTGIR